MYVKRILLTLAEGAGNRLDAGDAQVRVTLEQAAETLHLLELLAGKVSELAKGRVLDERGMALGKDEAIAVVALGFFIQI